MRVTLLPTVLLLACASGSDALPDAGSSDSAADHAGPAVFTLQCDPVAQTCDQAGHACLELCGAQGGRYTCLPATVKPAAKPGDPCRRIEDCAGSQVCRTATPPEGVCTALCRTHADCPAGTTCAAPRRTSCGGVEYQNPVGLCL
jgi:hypothetical protein